MPYIFGAINLQKSAELVMSIKYEKALIDPNKKSIRRKLDFDKENKLKILKIYLKKKTLIYYIV